MNPFRWIALCIALMQFALPAVGLIHLSIDHSSGKSRLVAMKRSAHDRATEESCCSICKYLAQAPTTGGTLETPTTLPTFEASRETRLVLQSIEQEPPLIQSTPTCGPPSMLVCASMGILV